VREIVGFKDNFPGTLDGTKEGKGFLAEDSKAAKYAYGGGSAITEITGQSVQIRT
jgi:hypothetical protein